MSSLFQDRRGSLQLIAWFGTSMVTRQAFSSGFALPDACEYQLSCSQSVLAVGDPVFVMFTAVNDTNSTIHVGNLERTHFALEFTATLRDGSPLAKSKFEVDQERHDDQQLRFLRPLAPAMKKCWVHLVDPWTDAFLRETNVDSLQSVEIRSEFRGRARNAVSEYSPYNMSLPACSSCLSLREHLAIKNRASIFPTVSADIIKKLEADSRGTTLYKNYWVGQQLNLAFRMRKTVDDFAARLQEILSDTPIESRPWYSSQILSVVSSRRPEWLATLRNHKT